MPTAPEESLFLGLKKALSPSQLLPSLAGGSVVALFEVVLAVSFAALIFAGPLATFVANGIGLALLGTILCGAVTALLVTLPGTVSGNQEVPAAIMAIVAAAIASQVSGSPEAAFVTVVTAIVLTTVLTGLLFLGLGYFRLGRWVRFLPFPVIAGFLGGTGWLLITGSLGLMTDLSFDWSQLAIFLQEGTLIRWLPGLFFAIVLLLSSRVIDHFLLMPGLILLGTLLFYVIIWLTGSSLDVVRSMGWVLGPFPEQSLWQPITTLDFSLVEWGVIVRQAGSAVTIFLVSTLSLLLNAGGLELSMAEDIDLDQELRAAGFGNVVAGLFGGFVGYQQLSLSVLNMKMGATTRLTGLITAVLCLIMLFQGAALLAFVPKAVVGGLLLYLGLAFLLEWVVAPWSKLPLADMFIILLIVVVIATVGFLQGVSLGLAAAVILFGVNYGRTNVVRYELPGQFMRSRVTRSAQQRQALKPFLDQIHVWQLQGYIFFGTADALLVKIRSRMADPERPPLAYMVLDFHRVTGLDSTAVFSFQKLQQLAEKQNITVIYSGMLPHFQHQLGLALGENGYVGWFANLDEALEWCEDNLLGANGADSAETVPLMLRAQLHQVLSDEAAVDDLISYLTRREVAAGDLLIKQGSAPDTLFFVESGQVTALLERPSQEPIRLETMGNGRVVGEMGFYLQQVRTASVVADSVGVVYELSRQQLAQMEAEAPTAAAGLHRLIAHLLAARATHLVETVDALQR